MEIEKLEKYKCKIKIRPVFNGNKVKDGLEVLDGMELVLESMWMQAADDLYPGEWAMGDSFAEQGKRMFEITGGKLIWISSGDVEILEKVNC